MSICIYNDAPKGMCILKDVQLDQNGLCVSCIMPNIPNGIVEYYKKELLQKYHGDCRYGVKE